ncbi:MAG: hypothetical protein HC765_14255 [Brachymonas sp.]|nr:hypothetical protein [Brachymonas sp.]
MSCHGEPKEGISQPHAGSCNPYQGDASCRLALPVLCIKKDGSTPESALSTSAGTSAEPLKEQRDKDAITPNDVITDGWAGGSVASTEPVAGFVLARPKLRTRVAKKSWVQAGEWPVSMTARVAVKQAGVLWRSVAQGLIRAGAIGCMCGINPATVGTTNKEVMVWLGFT